MIKFFQNCISRSYSSRDIFLLAFGFLCINILINLYNASNGLGFPYDTFLFNSGDRFGDFFKVIGAINNVVTFENVYPEFIYYEHVLPFSATYYLTFATLIKFTGARDVVFLSMYLLLLLITILVLKKQGNSVTILFLSLCSYPMIFALDRGNLAIVVFVVLLLALCSEKLIYSTLAVAIAASIKLTPAIFLIPILLDGPFSTQRIKKASLLFFGWFLVLNLLAILINGYFLTPHVYNPAVLLAGITGRYTNQYVNAMAGLGYGSSLYMPTVYIFYKQGLHSFFVTHFRPLTIAAFVGLVIATLSLRKRKFMELIRFAMTRDKMTFILCIVFILFMPVTGDYYLLIMLIPLLVYPKMYYSFSYFLLYGALIGAKNFFYVDFISYINISIQVFLNPILLLLLLLAEFDLIGFTNRSFDQNKLNMEQSNSLNAIKQNWKRNLLVTTTVLAIVVPAYFYFSIDSKDTVRNKTFASAFNQKDWSYSTDGGKSWIGGAENALKKFNSKGRPVHNDFIWGVGKWNDENTIEWTSVVKSKAIWKGIRDYSKDILSEEDVVKNTQYAKDFKNKTWAYSVDDGLTWAGPSEGALKEFDKKGRPIHIDAIWRIGKWKNADTILWAATNGSSAIWKGIPLPNNSEPTSEDIIQWKKFSAIFAAKKWQSSADGEKTWQDGAETGLKDFDKNGRPVHVDLVWGKGNWENENKIRWTATNGSISFWKASVPVETIELTEVEINNGNKFSQTFKNKKWYYSVDKGVTWQHGADSGLKEFDKNGSPVHIDAIWGLGEWVDENTIHWVAQNGSESIWKAFEKEPE